MNSIYNATLELLNDFFSASKDLIDFNNNISNNLLRLLNAQGFVNQNTQIENTIKEFYKSKGLKATIQFNKNALQIQTTIQNPNDNAYIHFLSLWIKTQFKNQKKVDSATLQSIINHAKQTLVILDEMLLRDIIRHAIKQSFNLSFRDSLFFKDFAVHIKKFDYEFAQINKELRNVKKLNSSQLLTITEKNNILAMLKSSNINAILQECTHNILQNYKTFSLSLSQEFYDTFFYTITRDFRTQIGKILGNKVSSINQTCFAEDFIRENILLVLTPLAKQMLHYFFTNAELYDSFMQTYQKKLSSQLSNQSTQFLHQTIEEYFATQESINQKTHSIENFTLQIQENDKTIFNLQQQAIKKDTELQELNKNYDTQKSNLKSSSLTSAEQEEINNNLSKLINEQKITLGELERLTEGIEKLKKDNNALNQEKKLLQSQIQDIQANTFSKTENFNLICNNFANYLAEHKNENQ